MLKHLLVFLIVFSGLLYVKWAVVHNEIETALEVLCSSKLNFQFLEMNFQNKRTVSSQAPAPGRPGGPRVAPWPACGRRPQPSTAAWSRGRGPPTPSVASVRGAPPLRLH